MAGQTYVPIATTTLSAYASSYTFSSIPATYTDLVLIATGFLTTSGQGIKIRFNGDTANNYSNTVVAGTGSIAESGRDASATYGRLTYDAGWEITANDAMITAHIMNYANTTTYKTYLSRAGRAGSGVDAIVGLWRSTAAINSITILPAANQFNYPSTFTLYGIASSDLSAYATGGMIYSDSTYYYHAFTGSGTFTPNRNLTADILVVAGGGGAGSRGGGGGGAGGLQAFTSQSLTSGTTYACTVGAGGSAGTSSAGQSGTAGGNSQFGALTAATGGGYGAGENAAGGAGGSGGGSGAGSASAGGTGSQGSNGGTASVNAGGGGGGNTAVGSNATTTTGGNGGAGSSTYSSWLSATGYGQNVSGTWYIAGGGGGGTEYAGYSGGTGGNGGGGAGGLTYVSTGNAGSANTGGGGGGGGAGAGVGYAGAAGGSGIIIVRYAK